MKQNKCDKCKKSYDPQEHQCGVVNISVYDSNHSSWPGTNDYDFCPQCMYEMEKSILSWIKT
ncbi:hypothetical protein LCGC14_1779290 [marine sediment metagenome]|uniref:Uncharacterized protein n=1 Tax=marine sediment metagenome TaxID=412755 RepID=A0A0F9JAU4_9ZZZZ